MMSLWDALRMNMMISYQELVRTFHNITVYDEAQWEKLRERPSCPYHAGGERSDSCFYQSFCTIKRCPNNIPRSEPWR
ncbi:anti-adapter protein iraM [Klebsiella pneumoniae]|nr:anti-adapter protein iraM [Klebsiella pneumoniae]